VEVVQLLGLYREGYLVHGSLVVHEDWEVSAIVVPTEFRRLDLPFRVRTRFLERGRKLGLAMVTAHGVSTDSLPPHLEFI